MILVCVFEYMEIYCRIYEHRVRINQSTNLPLRLFLVVWMCVFLCLPLNRVDSVNSSLRVLEESCLVPFLQQLLENDSLLDVDRHASLYTSVLKVLFFFAYAIVL